MTPEHIVNVKEAVEYLQQFAWVKDFDSVIEQIIEGKAKEKDDEDKNV